jgi:hypothetical protein
MRVAIRVASRQLSRATLGPQKFDGIFSKLEPTHPIANPRNGATPSLDAAPLLSLDALDAVALSALTPPQLAAVTQRLAALLASISIAQFQHASAQADAKDASPTRWLDADEACAIMHKPRRWLFAHARRYAWIKRVSRKTLLCDEAGLHRWLQSRH